MTSTGSFLARAVADARSDAERRAERLPLDLLRAAAAELPPARGLRAAVRRGPDGPRVIAEVKRRSPTKGDIRIDHDPGRPTGLVELLVAMDMEEHLLSSLESRGWVTHR